MLNAMKSVAAFVLVIAATGVFSAEKVVTVDSQWVIGGTNGWATAVNSGGEVFAGNMRPAAGGGFSKLADLNSAPNSKAKPPFAIGCGDHDIADQQWCAIVDSSGRVFVGPARPSTAIWRENGKVVGRAPFSVGCGRNNFCIIGDADGNTFIGSANPPDGKWTSRGKLPKMQP